MGSGIQSTSAAGPRQKRQRRKPPSSVKPRPPSSPAEKHGSFASHSPRLFGASGRGNGHHSESDGERSDSRETKTFMSSGSESDYSDSDVGGANHK